MNKKGMSSGTKTFLWIFGILAIAFVILVSTGGFNKLSTTENIASGDYDGEFSDSAIADLEMGGSDLVANTSYAEANEAFTVAFETNVDVNGTDGDTQVLAFPIEVSGDMTDFKMEGALGSTIATTEMVIRSAYVVENKEGNNLDESDSLSDFVLSDLDKDQNAFTLEADVILDGEYVFVVEVKGIATSTIADGEALIDITVDADSEDNDAVDEGTVTLYNKI